MTPEQILALNATKTEKIRRLLALGLTRKQVAQLVGVNYGFVHNVYASQYGVAKPQKFSPEAFKLKRSFGIEIECIAPLSRETVAGAIREAGVPCVAEGYNHALREHWKVVTDASVSGGFEVVSPVLKGEGGFEPLRKVCAVLNQLGCRLSTATGLHVHLGMDDIKDNVKVWKHLFYNYATLEGAIDGVLPPSRRGENNRFCRSLRVAGWEAKIEAASTLKQLSQSLTGRCRYFKLNAESYWRHGTVEFRQHSGTVEFEKIRNWVLFCARLVEFSRKHRIAGDAASEMDRLLDADLTRYFATRRLKFAA